MHGICHTKLAKESVMRLPRFELKQPESLNDAAELLYRHGSSAELAAGGTDLFPRLKYRLAGPDVLVSLQKISSGPPTEDPKGYLGLDALMKLADIWRSDVIQRNAPLLAAAAHSIGSSQIRNMATLGGNVCLETRCMYFNQSHDFQFVEPCFKRGGDLCYLVPKGKKCWAVCMADTAPALVCLEARVDLTNVDGTRQVQFEDLFTGNSLKPVDVGATDLVTRVLIPVSQGIRGWGFMKSSPRGGLEFATVNMAVLLEMLDDRETCMNARIVVGAISASPQRTQKAEELLKGQKLSQDLFEAVAEAVAEEIRPAPRPDYSRSYLKERVKILCRDCLSMARGTL
jgi:CO/xanthine dehydrogenase FAD-binding subunit